MESSSSMEFFDESEWVLADKTITNIDSNITDWVITDGDEGGVAGVFFHNRRGPFYASFARSSSLPDPSFSFLPPNATALSSSRGLLLLRGPWSSYYVADPCSALCRSIPRPPRPHRPDSSPSPALVASTSPNFHLICALDDDSSTDEHSYRFEVYSSEAGKWADSAAMVTAAKIVPGSGVSAAGVAYWRTSLPAILAFDPAVDKAWIVAPPPECSAAGDRWQLGEAAAGGLCCTMVTATSVVVYGLGDDGEWRALGSVAIAVSGGGEAVEYDSGDPIACVERPWPLRFESANLEAVLWVDGRVVAVDLESRRVRTVEIDLAPVVGGDAGVGGIGAGHVAGIGGLVAVAPVGSN